MKKTLFLLAALLVSAVAAASAQESHSPMYYWEYTETVTLHGKSFYGSKADDWGFSRNHTFADSYREQDGYALVLGRKLHYWLYDTITYHDGDASDIYDRIVPGWVEGMGYVIDFDHIEVYNPNTGLANSVKALMKRRGADVSVALVTRAGNSGTNNTNVDYVVINEYLNSKDVYKITIYLSI